MNTNDATLPIATGRSDLRPLRTHRELQSRVNELEAIIRRAQDFAKYAWGQELNGIPTVIDMLREADV